MATAEELAVRRAVRLCLADLDARAPVLVACSGGADSLALAGGLAAEARRSGRSAGGVVVDHGLQAGSAELARSVARSLCALGLDPVETVHVMVGAGPGGPEARARQARYSALDAAAMRHRADAVLLGHTRDDQAETVLLGLARGAGARSLAGMPVAAGRYRRPLLDLDRAVVRAAVPAEMKPWDDPHNADPAYGRSRVRHRVLPVLESELGPGVSAALARTASLLRADADALDAWAERERAEARAGSGPDGLLVTALAALPEAVRTRILRWEAIEAGSPPTDLTAAHVRAVDELVTRWRGQRGVDLPGPVRALRQGGAVVFLPGARADRSARM